MNLGQITAVAGAIIGVAVVTIVVGSPNTAGIISATSKGFIGSLQASMGNQPIKQ